MIEEKTLYILRGMPNSGKTTVANKLTDYNVAADDFFDQFNNGEFDPRFLKAAHDYCRKTANRFMEDGLTPVAVHNTFTQSWEYKEYVDMAEDHGYTVHQIIVEKNHDNVNSHGVPDDKIEQMRNRFEVKL